ncbi:diguanylate cyclase [Nakamurella endophytica]|uniref:diguanylate cyclase n=1 Tax=Nakamurella endophytica TaxID=1748367 RepID=UPI001669654A|nr:diguanylate cyclase [Nakamurella endophytica]
MSLPDRPVGTPSWTVLHRLITTIHGQPSVLDTVQAVADGVVTDTGFGVAVISVLRSDDELETVAVAGSESARAELLGVRRTRAHYEEEFAAAEPWGRLLFVPHDRATSLEPGWVPDIPVSDDAAAWHPMDALFAPLRSPSGELVGVLSVDLPVDGRRPGREQRELLEVLAVQAGIAIDNARLTERLRLREELFRLAFDGAGTGIAILGATGDGAGRYQRVNRAFLDIVGRPAEHVLGRRPDDLTHPEDREEPEPDQDRPVRGVGPVTADGRDGAAAGDGDAIALAPPGPGDREVVESERRYLRADGTPVWVSVTQTVVRSDDGALRYLVHQIDDISRRRAQQEDLHHRAHHDALTDLPNRSSLWDRLVRAVEVAEATERDGLMLLVDLDQFKTINDRHGHLAGDRVLTAVAQRLQGALRAADMVGRLGGDEFVVIADGIDGEDARQLADRVRAAVAVPVTVGDATVMVTASVGSAVIPAVGADPGVLMRTADEAMYRDKGAAAG